MKILKVCVGIFFLVGFFVLEGQPAQSSIPPVEYIYWTNFGANQIGRASLDLNEFQQDFIPLPWIDNLQTGSCGIAVNEKYIYWTNRNLGSIGQADLLGKIINLYLIPGCFQPNGLAIDDNYIFWTNGGPGLMNSIGRANLDGSDADQNFIHLDPFSNPYGIAIAGNVLYWTLARGEENPSYGQCSIARAELTPTGPAVNLWWINIFSLAGPWVSTHGITITDTQIFWTNGLVGGGLTGAIYQANLDKPSEAALWLGVDRGPVGILTRGDYVYWASTNGNIGRTDLNKVEIIPCWIQSTSHIGGIALTPQSVKYTFEGFFSPIDNIPTVNKANAGQAIPVKWRLTDKNGLAVSDPASFKSITSYGVNCATFGGATTDEVEEYAAGSSGLQYKGDGWWQFNWKTPKTYKGQCRTMKLTLDDHSEHTASFSFK
jgi:hypothetical protein